MKEKGKSVPASGGEDACSADGFSPIASLYLTSVFTCLRVPFVFSAAFEAEKMMKRPACWEFVLRCFFFLCRDVCKDEGNGGDNSLCMLVSFSLLLSVYYFFLWVFALVLTLFFALVFFLFSLRSVFIVSESLRV